jgi:hypothetical protein
MRARLLCVLMCVLAGCQSTPTTTPAPRPSSSPAPPAPIVQPTPAPPQLTLTLDPIPARQGGQVNVSGRGFAPGETVSISVIGTPLGATIASDQGAFVNATVNLPELLDSGPHPIQAIGQSSQTRSVATLWIRARDPWLVLSTYALQPMADLGFILGGFEPQEAVRVTLDTAALTEVPTDQAGNSEWAQVKLPLMPPGTYSLVLRGVASGLELHRDITLDPLQPTVDLSPWAGPPGMPVQLNARGFAPNERIHVAFGGPGVDAAVLQADQDGNVWGGGPIRIPATALMGALPIVLTGEQSTARAEPKFSVLEVKPWLELTSWSGAPGVQVGFAGGGWTGGERVTFHVGTESAPVAAEAQADDYGWLHTSGLATVPRDAETDVTFVALGEASHATARATYKVIFPFDLHPRRSP